MELSRNNSTANFDAPPAAAPLAAPPTLGAGGSLAPPPAMPGANKYSAGLSKKRGALGRVDVFKNSQSSPALSNNNLPPPSELFMPMAAPIPAPIAAPSDEIDTNNVLSAPASTAPTPSDGPVFFNPNSVSGPAPTTRRNKY